MRIAPRLPGVDRAQRLRPGHHADRAVRVDDRDDDLPAQPRAGQAARRAARAARHPARRPERGHAPSCASGSPAPADRAGRRSPAATTEVGTPRTASDESIVFQVERGLHDPAGAPDGLRASQRAGAAQGRRRRRRRGAPAGRRPARLRHAAEGRRRALPRLRRRRSARLLLRDRRRRLAGPRRRRGSRGPAAALGGLRRAGRRRVERGDRARPT